MLSTNNLSARAIKRVLYDLKELEENPIQNASICMPDVNDPFTLHCNILVKEGLYEGLIFHLICHIPHDYPMSAPAINIAPGLQFDKTYHSHVYDAVPYVKSEFFDKVDYGHIVCTPLTSLFSGYFRLSENEKDAVKTMWLPGYSLTSLLMQLQGFFADHNLPVSKLPTKSEVEKLKEHVSLYMLDITVNDGSNSEVITHTFYNPYPSLSSFKNISEGKRNIEVKPKSLKKAEESNSTTSATISENGGDWVNDADISDNEESKEEQNDFVSSAWGEPIKKVKPRKGQQKKESNCQVVVESFDKKTLYSTREVELPENHQEISQRIICSINKIDIFDESRPIFGYAIDLRKDQFKNIWAHPLPEMISQSAYMLNFRQKLLTTPKYEDYAFKSASGSSYNFWLPIYINEEHFASNKKEFYNAIQVLYDKMQNKKSENFNSAMILKVLPPILMKLLAQLAKAQVDQASEILVAYCHFYQLLIRMIRIFPNLQKIIDKEVELFCQDEKYRNKQALPDLNEFIIKLSLSSKGFDSSKQAVSFLFKEYLTRQVPVACKFDRGLIRTEKCPNFLKRFTGAIKNSNYFFLTQFVSARILQSSVLRAELDQNYGLLQEPILEDFKTELMWNQDLASADLRLMIGELKLGDEISDGAKIIQYLCERFKDADTKGYIKK